MDLKHGKLSNRKVEKNSDRKNCRLKSIFARYSKSLFTEEAKSVTIRCTCSRMQWRENSNSLFSVGNILRTENAVLFILYWAEVAEVPEDSEFSEV